MKQYFPPARFPVRRIRGQICALVTIALFSSACATLPYPVVETRASFRASTSETPALTNINSASTKELEKLPGIGKAIAERIIEHRDKYGPFRRAEHLLMVRGISDRKFRELRDLITTQ